MANFPVAYRRGAAKYIDTTGPSNVVHGPTPKSVLQSIVDSGSPLLDAVLNQTASYHLQPTPFLDYVLEYGSANKTPLPPLEGVEPPSPSRFRGGTALSAGAAALGAAYGAYQMVELAKQPITHAILAIQSIAQGFVVPSNWTTDCTAAPIEPHAFAPWMSTGWWQTAGAFNHAPAAQFAGVKLSACPDFSWAIYLVQSTKSVQVGCSIAHFQRLSSGAVPYLRSASKTVLIEPIKEVDTGYMPPIGQPVAQPTGYAKPKPESPWHETGTSTGTGTGGGGDGTYDLPTREGRGEKGRKFDSRSTIGRILSRYTQTVQVYDTTGEVCDLVESMYEALPQARRLSYQKGRVITCALKAQQVYRHLDEVDWRQFQDNWLVNELEDQIVGRTAGQASKGFRQASKRQLVGGLTSGPAL